MKKFALLLLLFSFSVNAQESFDIDDSLAKIRDINSGYVSKLHDIKLTLLKNESKLSTNKTNLTDPNISAAKEALLQLSEEDQKKISTFLPFSYFEKEWEDQKSQRDNLLEKQKKAENSEAKNTGSNGKENPYEILRRSLLGISKNPNFTVFRNIDYSFANTSFSWYLQEEMRLASKDYTTSPTLVTETYIPKASSKNEYLKVSYNTTIKENIQGYHGSKLVRVINSVEIVGTSNLIIDLFVNYWNDKITLGGNKEGEIANRQFLGDHVSLIRMKNNLCKILITKGTLDVNYETTYGIHKPITK